MRAIAMKTTTAAAALDMPRGSREREIETTTVVVVVDMLGRADLGRVQYMESFLEE